MAVMQCVVVCGCCLHSSHVSDSPGTAMSAVYLGSAVKVLLLGSSELAGASPASVFTCGLQTNKTTN